MQCGKLLRIGGSHGCDGAVRGWIILGGVGCKLLKLSRGKLLLGRCDRDAMRVWYLLRLDGPHGGDRRLRGGQLRGCWCDCMHGMPFGILSERHDSSIVHSVRGRLLRDTGQRCDELQ